MRSVVFNEVCLEEIGTSIRGIRFNLILNVGINHIAYRFTKDITISYFTALFITVSIGFIGQKYWVFKKLSN